jgi:hypothetical protein
VKSTSEPALIFGLGGLTMIYISGDWNVGWKVWAGNFVFIALGFWYLVKGRSAESQTPVEAAAPRIGRHHE